MDIELETQRKTLGAENANVKRLEWARLATDKALQRRLDAIRSTATQPATPTRGELVNQIASLITETIAVGTWRSGGGNLGSIRELNGQLIVTHTSDTHRQIGDLLAKLREQRSIQIMVESRFVLVDPAKLPPGVWRSRIEQSASADSKNLAGSWFLDAKQATELISQLKAMPSANLVTSPRLTIFNGQRAAVLVSTSTPYVTNWRKAVHDGKEAWEPQTATAESGFRMELTGTCSADRKSVTLTVQPQISTLLRIETEPFEPAGEATNAAGEKLTIQRPVMNEQSIRTTVSVPNGQTIAVCGLTVPPEVDPLNGKASTNAKADGPRVMLMLLNPLVIDQREIEP